MHIIHSITIDGVEHHGISRYSISSNLHFNSLVDCCPNIYIYVYICIYIYTHPIMFHLGIYTCISSWIFSGNILYKSVDSGISRKMNHEFRITLIHPGYMLKYVYHPFLLLLK